MTEVKLDLDGLEAVWLERLAKDLAERDGFTWTRERVLMTGRGGSRSRLTFERSATDIMQLPSVRAILALAREAEGQGWRDIESAPRGSWKDIPGPKGSTRRVHVPDLVILAGSDGETVTVSRWLPREERWNMFSKNETPLGWMPFPVHPAKATPPSRTQSGEDA